STKMIWPSGRVTIPWMRVRVVCGFDETAAMCSPTRALSKVDLPALGRPMSAANPDLCFSVIPAPTSKHEITLGLRLRRRRSFSDFLFLFRGLNRLLNSHARDAAFVGLNHLKPQSAKRDLFADRGQVSKLVDDQAGDRREIVSGQLDIEYAFDLADF